MTADPVEQIPEPIQLNAQDRKAGKIVQIGLGYEWDTGYKGIVMKADRIAPVYSGHDLQAEVQVVIRKSSGDGHVHCSNYVISSPNGREGLLKALVRHPQFRKWGISNGKPNDLYSSENDRLFELVENFCTGVQFQKRNSSEVHVVQKRAKTPIQYLLESLVLKSNRPNLLFAPGGSGKSYVLAAMCVGMMTNHGIGGLSVMPGCVPGYFDWEDDFDVFEDRVNTVSRGYGFDEPPPIPHFRMRGGTIAEKINDIARFVSEYHLNVGVIDSMSAAAGTTSSGQGWDTVAHTVFNALELIPDVTWIIVGHVDKAHLSKPAGAIFGSIQTMNRASNAWEVRSEQTPGDKVVHMKFHDSKHNHTGFREVIGIAMEFEGDSVTFVSEAANNVPSNLIDRMTLALMNGQQLTRKELAERVDAQYGSITTVLSIDRKKTDDEKRFVDIKGGLVGLSPQWDGTEESASEEAKTLLSETDEPLPW